MRLKILKFLRQRLTRRIAEQKQMHKQKRAGGSPARQCSKV
ncbi:hypothetical protein K788_0008355 [Paraburkholderia caribensis MBA4]|uniref:Uncharacterized protein n=1 Tax=Paraburkholderia caribensis MBA4 TaxID=1323664 RepID=A0A0P0R8M9_9BURK|nr:hypothetical protein K788_0008355 [Paraburkholderia caribensis MBA4]